MEYNPWGAEEEVEDELAEQTTLHPRAPLGMVYFPVVPNPNDQDLKTGCFHQRDVIVVLIWRMEYDRPSHKAMVETGDSCVAPKTTL